MTEGLTAAEAVDVVRQAYEHQDEEERDPDRGHALVDLTPDRTAAEPFDDREQDVAAVEGSSGSRFRIASERLISPRICRNSVKVSETAWLETSTIPTGLETSFLPDPVSSLGKNVIVAFVAAQLVLTLWVNAPIGP